MSILPIKRAMVSVPMEFKAPKELKSQIKENQGKENINLINQEIVDSPKESLGSEKTISTLQDRMSRTILDFIKDKEDNNDKSVKIEKTIRSLSLMNPEDFSEGDVKGLKKLLANIDASFIKDVPNDTKDKEDNNYQSAKIEKMIRSLSSMNSEDFSEGDVKGLKKLLANIEASYIKDVPNDTTYHLMQ